MKYSAGRPLKNTQIQNGDTLKIKNHIDPPDGHVELLG
jgi:hypothetical protein